MLKARSEAAPPQGVSLRRYTLILVPLVIMFVLMVVIFVLLERQDRINKIYLQRTTEQQLLSLSVVTQAFEASRGKEAAFGKLEESRNRFAEILAIQKNGSTAENLPPASATILPAVNELETRWRQINDSVQLILKGRASVLSVSDFVPLLEGLIPQFLELSDQVAVTLVEGNASSRQVYLATRQLLLGQRIASNLNRMQAGGEGAAKGADAFSRDVALFGRVLKGLTSGDPQLRVERVGGGAAAKVAELSQLFQSIEGEASRILSNAPDLFQVQKATEDIARKSDGLLQASTNLRLQYEALAAHGVNLFGLNINYVYAYVCGVITLILLAILATAMIRETRLRLQESEQRKQETEEQNRRNQEAILRLLDELGNLAEGDLTVQASVTEDITGAIADSVNYAIEALRDLVSTINNTSELVAAAAQETRGVADRLARASEVQARQIESASGTVMQMAQFMDEVSAKTAASAEVAEKSVSIAHEGGDRVRHTIQGMDAIREHIQETSKRIKRLGDSSQEIGNIVALINDIADQTNILALNAAIQASAAGEAGRGFAVVADEVQRLAERSGNATKSIEVLVKTIQTDTNEANNSMDKSINEVVNGAGLAEKAGEALEEIETVSGRLAELINDVSKAARQVTEMASRVSGAMKSINEITAQTSESSIVTASYISKLNQLAQELRQSVAGFRLPDSAVGAGG